MSNEGTGVVNLLVIESSDAPDQLSDSLASHDGVLLDCKGKLSEGILALTQNHYTSILLDLNLPDSHGLDSLRRLKRLAKNTPIIVMLHDANGALIEKLKREGADDHFLKTDFNAEKLLETIRATHHRKAGSSAKTTAPTNGLIDMIPCGHAFIENDKILFCNQTLAKILGQQKEQVTNQPLSKYIHPSYTDYINKWLNRLTQGERKTASIETIFIRADQEPINVEITGGAVNHEGRTVSQVIITDVTEKKKNEIDLQYLAQSEALSGSINKQFLHDVVKKALASAEMAKEHVGIFCLSLDQFQLINDTFGYKIADILTQTALQRLKKNTPPNATIVNTSASEYIIVIPAIKDIAEISTIAQRLVKEIADTYIIESNDVYTNASIGISVSPENGVDSDVLLKNADLTLYHAKKQQRNNFMLYTPSMGKHVQEKTEILQDLRHAISNNEFILYYQPIIDSKNDKIVAVESLLRWNRQGKDILTPDKFLSLSEEIGMIHDIGEWVINAVAEQNTKWIKAGIKPVEIGINLSSQQFSDKDKITNTIKSIISKTNLEPKYFCFEMSETITVLGTATDTLKELQKIGTKIAIDNFGQSYFSLTELVNYNINTIKIDRSLINGLGQKDGDKVIDAIISMAKDIGLEVVAEGVETKEQLDALKKKGCHLVQGYYFSGAISAEEIEPHLKKGKFKK